MQDQVKKIVKEQVKSVVKEAMLKDLPPAAQNDLKRGLRSIRRFFKTNDVQESSPVWFNNKGYKAHGELPGGDWIMGSVQLTSSGNLVFEFSVSPGRGSKIIYEKVSARGRDLVKTYSDVREQYNAQVMEFAKRNSLK